MTRLVFGVVMGLVGLAATVSSRNFLAAAVRVWPRPLTVADGERFASTEFLVRFVGLLVALAGAALVAGYFIES